jgi:hypothetical protein
VALGASLSIRLYVPGQGTIDMSEVSDRRWQPNYTIQRAPDGNRYSYVGEPHDFAPGALPKVRVFEPSTSEGSDFGLYVVSETTQAESSTDITVPGEAQGSNGMAGSGVSTVNGQIPLITVRGKLVDVHMSWGDTSSAGSTANSRHQLIPGAPIELGGGGGFIVDPPPPSGTLKVRILAIMYVPMWTDYVPETGRAR